MPGKAAAVFPLLRSTPPSSSYPRLLPLILRSGNTGVSGVTRKPPPAWLSGGGGAMGGIAQADGRGAASYTGAPARARPPARSRNSGAGSSRTAGQVGSSFCGSNVAAALQPATAPGRAGRPARLGPASAAATWRRRCSRQRHRAEPDGRRGWVQLLRQQRGGGAAPERRHRRRRGAAAGADEPGGTPGGASPSSGALLKRRRDEFDSRSEVSWDCLGGRFVPRGSIQSLLGKLGSFPEPVIKKYTKKILQGLEYLHSNAIIHRDIKGANILVDNKGCIKLADFGASKQAAKLIGFGWSVDG